MQRSQLTASAFLAVLVAGTATSLADRIDVPADYATIQAAIDAAAPGDEIVVAPGEYVGPILIEEAITVRSSDGPSATVLRGAGNQPVVALKSSSGPGGTLAGFTVTGGVGQNGGGLFLSGDVAVADCVVTDNEAERGGGAFLAGSPMLTGVRFEANEARWGGAVFAAPGAEVLLETCEFIGNRAELGGAAFLSPPVTDDGYTVIGASHFEANSADEGGAVYSAMGGFGVSGSSFVDNDASGLGGAFRLVETPASSISGSEFKNNSSGLGGGAVSLGEGSDLLVTGSTFSENSAVAFGGGLENESGSFLSVEASVLWGNTPEAIDGVWNDLGGNSFTRPPLCEADLAAPFGSLTSADVMAWYALFVSRDASIDFAAPFGVVTFADASAFINMYLTGCGQ